MEAVLHLKLKVRHRYRRWSSAHAVFFQCCSDEFYFFVAHRVFKVSGCFVYRLPRLPQACEQHTVAVFLLLRDTA